MLKSASDPGTRECPAAGGSGSDTPFLGRFCDNVLGEVELLLPTPQEVAGMGDSVI